MLRVARKRMNIYEGAGNRPGILSAQKEKVHSVCKRHVYKKTIKLELKIIQEYIANYLGRHIHLYKNVKNHCLCVAFIGQALLSMQKMYYNI